MVAVVMVAVVMVGVAVVMVLATVAGSGFTGVATMVAHTITGLAAGGAAAIIAGSVRTTDGSRTLSPTEAIRAGLFIMPVPESFKGRPCTCRSSCNNRPGRASTSLVVFDLALADQAPATLCDVSLLVPARHALVNSLLSRWLVGGSGLLFPLHQGIIGF